MVSLARQANSRMIRCTMKDCKPRSSLSSVASSQDARGRSVDYSRYGHHLRWTRIAGGDAFENLSRRLRDPQVDRVVVTICISVEEKMRGWLSYVAASRTTSRQVDGYLRLNRMIHWYQQQEVLDFDPAAADIFDELKRARVRIGPMDLKIAAIALDHKALLISRNLPRTSGRVPSLRVEDWTQ